MLSFAVVKFWPCICSLKTFKLRLKVLRLIKSRSSWESSLRGKVDCPSSLYRCCGIVLKSNDNLTLILFQNLKKYDTIHLTMCQVKSYHHYDKCFSWEKTILRKSKIKISSSVILLMIKKVWKLFNTSIQDIRELY